MKFRNVMSSAIVCGLGLWSAPALAETVTAKVVGVRGGMSYLEITMSAQVCTNNGIPQDWGSKPRISFGSYTAESVQSLATAALLSGKDLTVLATVSGSGSSARCIIDSVVLRG
jgi:hypothetical protein